MDLLELFRIRFPKLSHLRAEVLDSELCLGPAKELTLSRDDERWTLYSQERHAHFETVEDALDMAVAVLFGNARFANEYRGDEQAASWIEIKQGEVYSRDHTAIYLTPFDIDEWTARPGEDWKVVRTELKLESDGTIGRTSFERTDERSMVRPTDMMGWLETGLGPPESGMRWTVGASPRFVFQKPAGWRRIAGQEGKQHYDYSLPGGEMIFRAYCYFREADDPVEPILTAVRPYDRHYEEGSMEPDWRRFTWKLLFTDNRLVMMGVLELFVQPGLATEGERVRALVDHSAHHALYVPDEWNMTRGAG